VTRMQWMTFVASMVWDPIREFEPVGRIGAARPPQCGHAVDPGDGFVSASWERRRGHLRTIDARLAVSLGHCTSLYQSSERGPTHVESVATIHA
jgi:hypothetical protein